MRIGGEDFSAAENIGVEMEKQGLADYKNLMQTIAWLEIEEQGRIPNLASRVVVDGREGKPLWQVTRRIEVLFGTIVDRALFKSLERQLRLSIRKRMHPDLPEELRSAQLALSDIGGSWKWMISPPGQDEFFKFNPYREGPNFAIGTKIILRPRRIAAGHLNMWSLYAGKTVKGRGKNKGKRFFTEIGFVHEAVNKVRRNPLFKYYQINVPFTKENRATVGDIQQRKAEYKTPYISITIKRRKKAYKKVERKLVRG